MCIQSSGTQQNLLGFFAEAVTEMGVKETDDGAMVALDVSSSVSNSINGKNIDSQEGSIKSKKRKRVMVEPLTNDDPEFISQKQKLSRKKVTSTVSPQKNECEYKQRTLTAMCSSPLSEGGSRERDVETGDTTTRSKASDLAMYLLSQQSTSSSTVTSSQRELVSTTVSKPVPSDAVKVNSTHSHRITVTSGTHGSCQYTHPQSTGGDSHTMSLGCTEREGPHSAVSGGWDWSSSGSGCDGQWLDDLAMGDCDLSSFVDFDDDGTFT